MDEELKNLITNWHIKADNDLITKKDIFQSEDIVTDSICFHA